MNTFDSKQFDGKVIRFLDALPMTEQFKDLKCPLCDAGFTPFKLIEELENVVIIEPKSESGFPHIVKIPKSLATKLLKLRDAIERKFNVALMCGDAVQCIELIGTSEEDIKQQVSCEYAGFRIMSIKEIYESTETQVTGL